MKTAVDQTVPAEISQNAIREKNATAWIAKVKMAMGDEPRKNVERWHFEFLCVCACLVYWWTNRKCIHTYLPLTVELFRSSRACGCCATLPLHVCFCYFSFSFHISLACCFFSTTFIVVGIVLHQCCCRWLSLVWPRASTGLIRAENEFFKTFFFRFTTIIKTVNKSKVKNGMKQQKTWNKYWKSK